MTFNHFHIGEQQPLLCPAWSGLIAPQLAAAHKRKWEIRRNRGEKRFFLRTIVIYARIRTDYGRR
jgi:hypothetical protein